MRRIVAGIIALLNLTLLGFLLGASADEVRHLLVNIRSTLTGEQVSDPGLFALDIPQLVHRGFLVDSRESKARWQGENGRLLASILHLAGKSDLEKGRGVAKMLQFNKRRQISYELPVEQKIELLASGEYVGFCSDYSESFTCLGSAAGLFVREVHNAKHTFNEFYDRERRKWVFIDPMFGLVAVDGSGASLSAFELRDRMLQGAPFRMLSISENTHHGNVPHLYGRKAFAKFSMTFGNNILEETGFNARLGDMPKPLRALYGIVTGSVPRHMEYVDSGTKQFLLTFNRYLAWILLFCSSFFFLYLMASLFRRARSAMSGKRKPKCFF